MVRRTNREELRGNERPGRRRPAKSGPPMGPILFLVVLMVAVVVVARWVAGRPKPNDVVLEKKQASDVYGDLEIEAPPVYTPGHRPKGLVDKAPAGLAQAEIFQRAQAIAKRADSVLSEAKRARIEGDHGTWNEKGVEAKELYNQAIMISADWEQGLMDQYGDNDRQVDAIMRERSKWFDLLGILHKTTGR